jgi:Holliday junction resolvase-like predicted endonuclease
MPLDANTIKELALAVCADDADRERVDAFVQVCRYLDENPQRVARSRTIDFAVATEVEKLAKKYFAAAKASVFPKPAKTVADPMVNTVLMVAFGHTAEQTSQIIDYHRQAMVAENCIGSLLERYLDSVLLQRGWAWCCGEIVRAIDFIRQDGEKWSCVQIKNRDNSENSSSSAIRDNTSIEKWFRSFSKTTQTNWENLPDGMRGLGLSEENFTTFVRDYLEKHKPNDPNS